MESKTLEQLESLCKRANLMTIVDSKNPKEFFLLDSVNGELETRTVHKVRGHHHRSLASIVKMAERFCSDSSGKEPAIWFSREGVHLIIDDEDSACHDMAKMPLELSPQMRLIQHLEKGVAYSQRDLILLLRTQLRAVIDRYPELISTLRTLKFSAESNGQSTVGHGQASLGKSIISKVEGTREIPEELVFNVPVFANGFPGMMQEVMVVIDVDSHSGQIKLHAVPDTSEMAIQRAEVEIGVLISEAVDAIYSRPESEDDGIDRTPIHVYFGKP